jgi:membrane protein required for colicin V production
VNWTDGVILGVLALSVLIGLFRGLVAELLSLVIWIAAFWFTWAFGPVVSMYLEHAITMPTARKAVAYSICFVVVLIVGALVRFMMRRLLWSSGLSGIDRLFGTVFGFLRGVLIVAVLVFMVGLTGFTREPWWQQSTLAPQFQGVAAWLGQAIPANVPASVRDHLHPQEMLDKIHPADMLNHLPDLSKLKNVPISGASSPSASSILDKFSSRPAPATSAPDHSPTH